MKMVETPFIRICYGAVFFSKSFMDTYVKEKKYISIDPRGGGIGIRFFDNDSNVSLRYRIKTVDETASYWQISCGKFLKGYKITSGSKRYTNFQADIDRNGNFVLIVKI